MVGRFMAKPKPGRVEENAAGEVIFRGSEGLWKTLLGVAALVGLMAIWVVVGTIASDGFGASVVPFLIGVGVCLFLLLGAWFARGQRREVVVDGSGLTVRTREGQVKTRLPWAQITRIEPRPLPSHPTQPAIMLHCADGTSHFIDPLQVHDTGTLVFEAQRRKKLADDAARAANLMGQKNVARDAGGNAG
jgi:hypothetical protein